MNENQAEQEYARFYIEYHPHQGLGTRTLTAAGEPPEELDIADAPEVGLVRRQRFLGGLLRHYYRDAA